MLELKSAFTADEGGRGSRCGGRIKGCEIVGVYQLQGDWHGHQQNAQRGHQRGFPGGARLRFVPGCGVQRPPDQRLLRVHGLLMAAVFILEHQSIPPFSMSRSIARARVSWLRTVEARWPVAAAISSVDSSSK